MAKKRKSGQRNSSTGTTSLRHQGLLTTQELQNGDRHRNRRFESFPLHLVPDDDYVGKDNSREIIELCKGRVWVIPSFFSHKECRAWIDFCESFSSSSNDEHRGGFQYTAHPASKYIANRECYRLQEANATELSKRIFQRLQKMTTTDSSSTSILSHLQSETADLYPPTRSGKKYKPIHCNPNIRVYRYDKGHSFGRHVDESNVVTGRACEGTTEMTMLVYLSTCQGGATRFHHPFGGRRLKNLSSSFAFEPQIGALLLHVHGKHCLEHEADVVLSGQKYVLRTDLVYGNE